LTRTSTWAISRSDSSSSTRASPDLSGAPAGLRGAVRLNSAELARQRLGLAHAELARGHLVGGGDLRRAVQRQQGARVAHVQIAGHQHGLHRLGQFSRRSRLLAALRLRPTACAACSCVRPNSRTRRLQALRLFQRVEVFALDVLDQRHGGGGFVGHVAHQHRHLGQARQARGAKRRSPAMIS
jgi:hypothetical protein